MYQLIGINLHPRILLLLLCFPSLLQAPLFYFPFTLILAIFSEAAPEIITVQYLDPFFLLSVITASELWSYILFSAYHRVLCRDARTHARPITHSPHINRQKQLENQNRSPVSWRHPRASRCFTSFCNKNAISHQGFLTSAVLKWNMFLWFIIQRDKLPSLSSILNEYLLSFSFILL